MFIKTNKTWKAIVKSLAVVGFGLLFVGIVVMSGNTASAQGGTAYNSTGSSTPLDCRGERDFSTTGIAIWNQFMDPSDFYEYWNDITVRYWDNLCYYEDIYGLIKKIDKSRKQIRSAFFACKMTPRLKNTYFKLETELYFLRNYVDYKNAKGEIWTEIAPIDEDWYDFTRSTTEDTAERQALFAEFSIKYQNRLSTYKNCKDPGIENMIATFNSDIDYLENTINNAKKGIAKSANRLAKTSGELWNSVKSGEFFTNLVEIRINGMSCPVLGYLTAPTETEEEKQKKEDKKQECLIAADQILQELQRNTPLIPVADLQQAVEAIAQEAARVESDTSSMAQYEFMYKLSSDNMTDQFTGRLDGLANIINGSFDPMNQTINCEKFVSNAQCQNIFGL